MKKRIIIGMLCLLVFMAGCSKTKESVTETGSSDGNETSVTAEAPDVVDGYLLVIDHLLNHSGGIYSDDKYLAIDTSKMLNLTPDDKVRLIKELGKYKLQVLNKTLDELKKEGYIKRTNFEEGVLIIIEDKSMWSNLTNSITMDATRYCGGLAGYGLLDFKIRFVSGHWEMAEVSITWKS